MRLSLIHILLPANTARFARFAQNVWGIDPAGKSELKLAQAGVEALAAFIKEIGTVSYTHLDVYKRQSFFRVVRAQVMIAEVSIRANVT